MSKTKLMGILNVTPDSFYDGGRYTELNEAIQRALAMVEEGADYIDIGGESTRPQAKPVSEEEELQRVIPLIKALTKLSSIPLSIDTMKPRVAIEAIKSGARLLNDVTGFRDPDMRRVAADTDVDICLMHMQGTPQNMQQAPSYPKGIIPHLIDFFSNRIDLLIQAGVSQSKIFLDPGIGFGKTVDDNLKILQNLRSLKSMGFPLLLGISRKSFMTKIINKPASELLPTTLAMSALVISQVDILRVHDVAPHHDVINLLDYYNQC
jgi:dihydropteroate synthase